MNSPLLMIPHFRSGRETPWAGDTLHRLYEKYALGNQIGESYDFCTLPDLESTLPDGTLLSAVTSSPFLVKWVDAKEPTSVHLHPQHSEYLIVLHAESNAHIVGGLSACTPPETLSRILESTPENAFSTLAVKAGDVIHIPAGVPHSLVGVTCYQVQENAAPSLRLYDWNRVNARGQSRPLQLEKAQAFLRADSAALLCASEENNRKRLIHASAFDVFEYTDFKSTLFPIQQPFGLLTSLSPSKIKLSNGRTLYLCAGQTVYIPGSCDSFYLTGKQFFFVAPHA